MPRDLEKTIGKDIRQATRYAEAKDEEVKNLQAAVKTLEEELKATIAKLATATDEAQEYWDYVNHLKEKA